MAQSISSIKNRLLTALPQEDLEPLLSHLNSVNLEQRQVLYEIGSVIEYVYFIDQGIASVITMMADGASVEIGMIGFEGMAGLRYLLGDDVSEQFVIAQIPGSALRMSAASCNTAFEEIAAFRKIMLRFTNSLLAFSAQTAACNGLHAIEQRLARWLLLSSDRIQSDLLPLPHEFVATMLGVRRSGVTVAAGELQRAGLIRYHHGQITITDREGLQEAACECYRVDLGRFNRLLNLNP